MKHPQGYTVPELIRKIQNGQIKCPVVSVEPYEFKHDYSEGEKEIETESLVIKYRYFAHRYTSEDDSKTIVQVEIIQAYDSEGMEIQLSHEYEIKLIEAIEKNTIVE